MENGSLMDPKRNFSMIAVKTTLSTLILLLKITIIFVAVDRSVMIHASSP